MKKLLLGLATIGLGLCTLTSCSSGGIQVYTRDTTSGTRDGFFTNIDFKDAIKDDRLLAQGAVTVASNGDMISYIANDVNGIGYASLASVVENSDKVKGLTFDGVTATNESVVDGTYKLSRNFNYVVALDSDMQANQAIMIKAFLKFMDSDEGLTIISSNDGILEKSISEAPKWSKLKTTDEDVLAALAIQEKVTINLGGSTSVEKIAEALTKQFSTEVKNFAPVHNHTGSGDAYKNTQGSGKGTLQIGFLSRELEAGEDVAEGTSGRICKDGIVCIVNPANNHLTNADVALLKGIFSGEVTSWSNLNN